MYRIWYTIWKPKLWFKYWIYYKHLWEFVWKLCFGLFVLLDRSVSVRPEEVGWKPHFRLTWRPAKACLPPQGRSCCVHVHSQPRHFVCSLHLTAQVHSFDTEGVQLLELCWFVCTTALGYTIRLGFFFWVFSLRCVFSVWSGRLCYQLRMAPVELPFFIQAL